MPCNCWQQWEPFVVEESQQKQVGGPSQTQSNQAINTPYGQSHRQRQLMELLHLKKVDPTKKN